jgi:hypothetical protein
MLLTTTKNSSRFSSTQGRIHGPAKSRPDQSTTTTHSPKIPDSISGDETILTPCILISGD